RSRSISARTGELPGLLSLPPVPEEMP
ncbi:MAG: hypothetical protein RL480_2181, partial [Pseudomonadota bacterium]